MERLLGILHGFELSCKKLLRIGSGYITITVIGLCLLKGCDKMQEFNNTQYFKVEAEKDLDVRVIIASVYSALTEKGYNPVNQIVGYLMSGDPTYITSHKGARSLIMRAERDEIIEVFLEDYIENNLKED